MNGWRKSSYSGNYGCVEVRRRDDGGMDVRDSKLGDASPVLEFDAREWAVFLNGVRNHEFDLTPQVKAARRTIHTQIGDRAMPVRHERLVGGVWVLDEGGAA